MTLECEEGVMRALSFEKTVASHHSPAVRHLSSFLGVPGSPNEFKIKRASEPSDIIWENRYLTRCKRLQRAIVVLIVVSSLLFASFIVVFQARQY